MISFLMGLGLAGFAVAVILFAKLNSLDPNMKAAVLGIRVILVVFVIAITGYLQGWWLSDEKVAPAPMRFKQFVGEWSWLRQNLSENRTLGIIRFKSDSTFTFTTTDNQEATSSWKYDEVDKILYLFYSNTTERYPLKEVKNSEIHFEDGDIFIRRPD